MPSDKKQKRIFHIAKELNISHLEIMKFLKSKDIEAKTHMAPVSGETYELILNEFSNEKRSIDRLRKEKARQEAVVSNIAKKDISLKKAPEVEDKKILKSNNEVKLTITKKADPSEKASLKVTKEPKVQSKKVVKEDIDIKKVLDDKAPLSDSQSVETVPKKPRKFKKIDLSTIADKISEGKSKGKAKDKISITQSVNKFSKKTNKKKSKKKESVEQLEQLESSDSKIIKLPEFTMVDELARSMDVAVQDVIKVCMDLGLMVTINQRLDFDTMLMVADEFDYTIESIEDKEVEVAGDLLEEEDSGSLCPRPPVVTVMGHVDHGKTSLLDYVRKENVVAGESGGITQHIGAYEVLLDNDKKITFLDTPGHAAFTAMRARGAQVTDIAIIIIAADDDVKPQTIEAIDHAKAASVPMIFAINKSDLPAADIDRVKKSLSEINILVEDWGGKYQCQAISAKSGDGIDDLLEKVLLEADLLDLKASKDTLAKGVIVESKLDKGLGPIATILVNKGTLKKGDMFICGTQYNKVRGLLNERNKPVEKAYPSDPVQVLGFTEVPNAGESFIIMDNEKEAKRIAGERSRLKREAEQRRYRKVTLDQIGQQISQGQIQELNIIIKGDVDGSIEAVSDALMSLSNKEVSVKIIHRSVGMITENDIVLANTSGAIIIAFNVAASNEAKMLSNEHKVEIRNYSIIYEAVNDIKLALEGLLQPDTVESALGVAEVRDTFKVPKLGVIAGCMIKEGKVMRNSLLRLVRDGEVVHEGKITSLKRFKDDVNEVLEGFECGIGIEGVKEYQNEDLIKVYELKEEKRKLEY